nr:hypothetical protein [uncultured Flavobacterium sp.]
MEKGTVIKLLLLAVGVGVVVYLINKSTTTAKNTAGLPANKAPATSVTQPTTATGQSTPAQATPLERNADQVRLGVVIPPGVPQLTKEQAQAALNEAKRVVPWLDYNKKLGYLYGTPEVAELQRLLEVAQIPGLFREHERDKLKAIKGVEYMSLSDFYLTPNIIDFNIIK